MGKLISARFAMVITTVLGWALCFAVQVTGRQPWRAVLLGASCLVAVGMVLMVRRMVREGEREMDQAERDNARMHKRVLKANERRAKAKIGGELTAAVINPRVHDGVEEKYNGLVRAGVLSEWAWREFVISSWEGRAARVLDEMIGVSSSERGEYLLELAELEAAITILVVCPAEWPRLVKEVAAELNLQIGK